MGELHALNNYTMDVDIKGRVPSTVPVFTQYDSVSIKFLIKDGGAPYDLSVFNRVDVYHTLVGGDIYIGEAEIVIGESIEDSYIRYIYKGGEMKKAGNVSTSIILYASDKKVTIQNFNVNVVPESGEGLPVTEEFGILHEMIQRVDESLEKAEDAELAYKVIIEDVQDGLDSLETGQETINELIDNANDVISKTDKVREDTEVVRDETVQAMDDVESIIDEAVESAEYAYEQGKRAEGISDGIEELMKDGAVQTINGKTGVVVLDAEDVGAVDVDAVGVADGVARLNTDGKVVDAEGNEVEGKVKSVNGKEGDVVLTADDIEDVYAIELRKIEDSQGQHTFIPQLVVPNANPIQLVSFLVLMAYMENVVEESKEYTDEQLEGIDLSEYATEAYVVQTLNQFLAVLPDMDTSEIEDKLSRLSSVDDVEDGTIDLTKGRAFTLELTDTTKIEIIPDEDDEYQEFVLSLSVGSRAHPITFPSNTHWVGDTVPDFSWTGTTYLISFITVDGGKRWMSSLINRHDKPLPYGYVLATDDDFSGTRSGDFKYIGSGGKVAIPHVIKGVPVTSYLRMFSSIDNVTGVYSDNPNIRNMSRMFYNNQSETLDVSHLSTEGVTDMVAMFNYCLSTYLDVSGFDTSSATNMFSMFEGCSSTTIDVSNFDTSNVTNTSNMFTDVVADSLDLSNFDTRNVTNMSHMFVGCKVPTLDLTSFDTSKVTNMSSMFLYNEATSIDVTSFNTSKVTEMGFMFFGSMAESLDLTNFDTRNVKVMDRMFLNSKARILDLSSFVTTNKTEMFLMFTLCQATEGYARTQADADRFNATDDIPEELVFKVK